LTEKTVDQLVAYMGFRHFYRHAYSFFLQWEELARLVLRLEQTWVTVKGELLQFLEALDTE